MPLQRNIGGKAYRCIKAVRTRKQYQREKIRRIHTVLGMQLCGVPLSSVFDRCFLRSHITLRIHLSAIRPRHLPGTVIRLSWWIRK